MSARFSEPAFAPDPTDGAWTIDSRRSQIGFETRALWGLRRVRGRFEEFDGSLDLRKHPAIELSVNVRSLGSGNAKRDEHLLSADFFDADEHPSITFASTIVSLDGDTLAITGRLNAAGSTILVTTDAVIDHEEGDLIVDASMVAHHRELGMTWNRLWTISGISTLQIHARLIRQEPSQRSAPSDRATPVRRGH